MASGEGSAFGKYFLIKKIAAGGMGEIFLAKLKGPVGFEKILLLYNPLTYPTADVISTYLYRVGIVSGNLSYAAAIGLFESVIGLTLVLSANAISRRTVGTSLW